MCTLLPTCHTQRGIEDPSSTSSLNVFFLNIGNGCDSETKITRPTSFDSDNGVCVCECSMAPLLDLATVCM